MTTMFRSSKDDLGNDIQQQKKGVDTEKSRNAFALQSLVASAPLNSRNSVTVTANSTIWRRKRNMAQAKSAQDDFNVNGIFWHYCARCQWEMGGWGLDSQLYSKRRWLFLKVFLQSSFVRRANHRRKANFQKLPRMFQPVSKIREYNQGSHLRFPFCDICSKNATFSLLL